MKKTLIISFILLAFLACKDSKKQTENSSEEKTATTSLTPEQQVAAAEDAVKENPLKEAYFGELHMHTALSLDALFGQIVDGPVMPDDSYRFAKGETVHISGHEHNIIRPLDFAAVTDHAEYIGESYSAITPGASGYDSPDLQDLRNSKNFDDQMAWYEKFSKNQRGAGGPVHPDYYAGPETTQSAWKMHQDAAAKHYEPGKFTTLMAYEWSSVVKGGNLHRNVIFRDMNVPIQPFSALESNDETKLWEWMSEQEKNGSTLFAIPHNSNAGKGLMFPSSYPDGRAIDKEYVELRNKYERTIEIMQIKGNSEVISQFWTNDEMAGFENAMSLQNYAGRTPMKQNYVRWGLIEGLKYQNEFGTNPFQLGLTGGTDNHNGAMSDVVESNFIGGHGPADNTPELRQTGEAPAWVLAKEENPGSITGVWATKNTRGAIYDGLYNREAFATSGTRIKVRFFAGENITSNPSSMEEMVKDGYANGLPMGGTLSQLTKAPTFNVYAQKDPEGANLDRIQIIKGWVDTDGNHQEQIIEVTWSGDRKLDAKGKLPAVANTVNVEDATYTNTIGAATLLGSWTDPNFDASVNAMYYVRVLEIPTPRWSTYDAVKANLELLEDVPVTIQERAWSSPIWYTPK